MLASIPEVPPMLRASWRLWATTIVLAPGFYAQRAWFTNADIRHGTLMILIGSGIALAIHFAAWTWSLDHTSLAHSLLFVTSHPLVIVCAMALIRGRLDWMLMGGAALGFLGAALALLDSSPSGEVTYAGDAAAFLGAVAGAAGAFNAATCNSNPIATSVIDAAACIFAVGADTTAFAFITQGAIRVAATTAATAAIQCGRFHSSSA